jgi:hypothetical protein
MPRSFIFILCLSLAFTNLFAQRPEDFQIVLPVDKVPNSLYNTISYLDTRYDTTYMGIVQLGAFNRKAKVIPRTHFSTQMSTILQTLIDSTSKNGQLLFQLRQFNFAEITGAMSEKGYCYIRASLYARINDRYRSLSTIDTVLLVKSLDVTKPLFRNGSKIITDYIASNLVMTPVDSTDLSYDDVLRMDSIDKRKIKVYNTARMTDGIYRDFESFRNQVPDTLTMTAEEKDGQLTSVKAPGEKGKLKKVKAKDVYAIVHNGKAFIGTDYGYYPLEKRGDDFYFTGKAKVTAAAGDVIMASVFFGLLGGLIASDANATFEMKIDHINGGFIRLKEVQGTLSGINN